MSLQHFLPTTTVLFCALWTTVSANDWNSLTNDQKGLAAWILVLIIVIPLCISASAAGAAFYFMRKRNSGGDQVLVVR